MLRQISEDVRVNLKDRLREVRDAIRQNRHDGAGDALREATSHLPPFPGKGIEGLLSHAASAVDDALSLAESLVPHERPAKVDGTTVKSLRSYFPAGDKDPLGGERLFRRDMYYLAKTVLGELKVSDVRIHEANFAAVHAAMRKRHADLLAALAGSNPAEQLAPVAAATAALLLEFLSQRPIRFSEAPVDMPAGVHGIALDIRCLAPLALACGLATVATDGSSEPDMLEIAVLATNVRHDRILQAFAKADPMSELTGVFAALLAHLP
ncbi:hypothetical protein [Mesorhizobium sp.]|uniref:hypothetical protein n=1 Tax=Mesorhizobium sp. TaxID=1871066 RepID=UPI003BAA40AE